MAWLNGWTSGIIIKCGQLHVKANKNWNYAKPLTDSQSVSRKYQAGGSYFVLFKYMPFIKTEPNIAFLDLCNKQEPGQI